MSRLNTYYSSHQNLLPIAKDKFYRATLETFNNNTKTFIDILVLSCIFTPTYNPPPTTINLEYQDYKISNDMTINCIFIIFIFIDFILLSVLFLLIVSFIYFIYKKA